jgi:hypothetical protein
VGQGLYSGVGVTAIVVAIGFAILALTFTRPQKPPGFNIEELDYLYGVNTGQLLDGNSTFYRGFHEIRCSLGNSVSNFSSSIQEGSDEVISRFVGRCK